MKRAKRFLALGICAALLMAMMAGCGGAPSSAAPVSSSGSAGSTSQAVEGNEEHLNITVGYWDVEAALANRETDTVLQTIEEKFNVTFEPVNVTWDDYSQKFQLWASSDSLPDLFASDVRTTATFAEWANDGLLHEIPQDLSAYPNLEKYLNSPEADPEGKNIQGMTACGPDYPVGVFFTYSMPAAVVGGNTFRWVDNGDGTYVPAYFAGENLGDAAVPTWQLLRDMYREGTIEADIALATNDQAYNKFLNGQCAAMLATGFCGPWEGMIQYWEEVNGSNYADAVKCLDLMPGVDGNAYYWIWDYAWSESYISSKVDDVKMDRILQIYDYLLSDEGVMLSRYGVEGDTYEIVDGKYIQESEDRAIKYPSTAMFHDLVAWTPELPNGYEFKSIIPQELLDISEARVEAARNAPVPEFDTRYTDIFISLGTDFGLSLADDMLTIMTGDQPVEEMWQAILENYKSQGLEDIIEQVNAKAKELGYQS